MTLRGFELKLGKYSIDHLVTRKFPRIAILAFIGFVALYSTSVAAQESVKDRFSEAADREAELITTIAEINTELQTVQADLDRARRLVTKSELTLEETAEQRELLDARIAELQVELSASAIEGYVASDAITADSGEVNSVTERLRATNLLGRIQKTRAELIAELALLLEEDRILDFSFDQAQQIREDNLAIQEAKTAELEERKDAQQAIYDSVKVELDNLESEAIASAELDDELRELIRERQKNTATSTGALQWPVASPRITSSFGNRTHPIYGSVRLHAGIDVCPSNASCSGANISSAGAGTVIFAGVKSGYGNTVIVDHGGGITTLYAHMTRIGVSEGTEILGRESIGTIGSTGNVTGAHLHFEVRVNGVPNNPRNFLS